MKVSVRGSAVLSRFTYNTEDMMFGHHAAKRRSNPQPAGQLTIPIARSVQVGESSVAILATASPLETSATAPAKA